MNNIFNKIFTFALLVSILCLGFLIGGYIIPTYEDTTYDTIFPDSKYINDDSKINSIDYTSNLDMTIEESQTGIVTVYAKEGENITSQGSGFMYTSDHIMTNEHVASGNEDYYVKYQNGEWSSAEFIGSDIETDIAILQPEYSPDYVSVLPMQMSLTTIGEPVVAIGSPSGLDTTITTGVVSSNKLLMDMETTFGIPDSIQTDAALNPGNSGGPLLSKTNAAVIGVNRATGGENIGYAVSSRMAHKVGQDLIEDGNHKHRYIGITTEELEYKSDIYENSNVNYGLVVSDVIDSSPASELSLRSEDSDYVYPDILLKIDDKKLYTNEDLSSYTALNTSPGDEIELKIYRQGEKMTKKVTVGTRITQR